MKFLLIVSLVTFLLYGCDNSKKSKDLAFEVVNCDERLQGMSFPKSPQHPKCVTTGMYKFKVRKYEDTVLLSDFHHDGEPYSNDFLSDCKIYDTNNWKCRDYSVVEGQLVASTSNVADTNIYIKIK